MKDTNFEAEKSKKIPVYRWVIAGICVLLTVLYAVLVFTGCISFDSLMKKVGIGAAKEPVSTVEQENKTETAVKVVPDKSEAEQETSSDEGKTVSEAGVDKEQGNKNQTKSDNKTNQNNIKSEDKSVVDSESADKDNGDAAEIVSDKEITKKDIVNDNQPSKKSLE